MSKRNTIVMRVAIAIALSLTACGGASWQQKVEDKILKQATFDLGCEQSNIQLVQIEESAIAMGHMYTYGARGCEKKATYKGMCASMGGCSTVMEGQVQAAPAAVSAPAPSSEPGAAAASPSAEPTSK